MKLYEIICVHTVDDNANGDTRVNPELTLNKKSNTNSKTRSDVTHSWK